MNAKLHAILATALALSGCTTGSIVMTGTARQKIAPEAVRVYPEMPFGSIELAIVSAVSPTSWTLQQSKDKCLTHLKKQAADVGANGLIIIGSQDDLSTRCTLTAKAIFVVDTIRGP